MISIDIELQKQIDALAKRLDDIAVRDRPGRLACTVYRNTTQSLATGVNALSWNTIKTDTSGGSIWTIANPTRLYAPVEGWYIAFACYLLPAAQITASDVRMGNIYQVSAGDFWSGLIAFTSNAVDFRPSWVGPMYLTAGQYVEAVVSNGFGTSKTVDAAIASNLTPNTGSLIKVA